MVLLLERVWQEIVPTKIDEYEKLNKEFDELELNKFGYPPKKRWRCLSGPHNIYTIIFEREWASMAKMERIITKAYLDPEIQALQQRIIELIIDTRTEYYVPHFGDVSEILKKE